MADPRPAPVRAVVLDVGETVLDRTREYASWARFFDVPAHTFSAVFGAMIARGQGVSDVVSYFGAGRSMSELHRERGPQPPVGEDELYPDVRPAIDALRSGGVVVGVAGNQPAGLAEQLRRLELGVDFVASSAEWGVAKPDRAFFDRAAELAGTDPGAAVYVGDQVRNDVLAPIAAGWRAIHLRRGPWGHLDRDAVRANEAWADVVGLAEVVALVMATRTGGPA